MRVVLYSDDINLARYWEKSLEGDCKLLDSCEDLQNMQNTLVLIDTKSCGAKMEGLFRSLYQQGNKIFVFDRVPALSKVKTLLQIPISGYANALMDKELLKGAVASIKEGATWIHPQLLSELIQNLDAPQTQEQDADKLEPLSEREREVALLIAKGHTYKQMADELDITPRTIKAHAQNIYTKLGVKDRFALALFLKN